MFINPKGDGKYITFSGISQSQVSLFSRTPSFSIVLYSIKREFREKFESWYSNHANSVKKLFSRLNEAKTMQHALNIQWLICSYANSVLSTFFNALRVSVRGFSLISIQTSRSERPKPRNCQRVKLKKLAAHVEGLLLIDMIDLSQHVFQ